MPTARRIEQYIEKEHKLYRNQSAKTWANGVLAVIAFGAAIAAFALTASWWAIPAGIAAVVLGYNAVGRAIDSNKRKQVHSAHVQVAREALESKSEEKALTVSKLVEADERAAISEAVKNTPAVVRGDEKKWAEYIVNRDRPKEKAEGRQVL